MYHFLFWSKYEIRPIRGTETKVRVRLVRLLREPERENVRKMDN